MNDFVRAHWEFVRRYMEDGPEAVSSLVKFCMPIELQRLDWDPHLSRKRLRRRARRALSQRQIVV
jgi:hypothetical protein